MLADEENIVEKMDLHEELLAPTFAQRPNRVASWSWEYRNILQKWMEVLENRATRPTLNSHDGIPTVKNAWSDGTRITANPFPTVEEVQL